MKRENVSSFHNFITFFFISTSLNSVKFVEDEKSFNLSTIGESPVPYGLFREVRDGFLPLIYKNSLFAINRKGMVIRISTKGKID